MMALADALLPAGLDAIHSSLMPCVLESEALAVTRARVHVHHMDEAFDPDGIIESVVALGHAVAASAAIEGDAGECLVHHLALAQAQSACGQHHSEYGEGGSAAQTTNEVSKVHCGPPVQRFGRT